MTVELPTIGPVRRHLGADHPVCPEAVAQHAEAVAEVEVEGKSAFLDIDTPEMLADARRG